MVLSKFTKIDLDELKERKIPYITEYKDRVLKVYFSDDFIDELKKLSDLVKVEIADPPFRGSPLSITEEISLYGEIYRAAINIADKVMERTRKKELNIILRKKDLDFEKIHKKAEEVREEKRILEQLMQEFRREVERVRDVVLWYSEYPELAKVGLSDGTVIVAFKYYVDKVQQALEQIRKVDVEKVMKSTVKKIKPLIEAIKIAKREYEILIWMDEKFRERPKKWEEKQEQEEEKKIRFYPGLGWGRRL